MCGPRLGGGRDVAIGSELSGRKVLEAVVAIGSSCNRLHKLLKRLVHG